MAALHRSTTAVSGARHFRGHPRHFPAHARGAGRPGALRARDYARLPRPSPPSRRQWGLDSSLPVQLGRFLIQLFQGNLGQSYIYHVSMASLIAEPGRARRPPSWRWPPSLRSSITVPMADAGRGAQERRGRPRRPGFVSGRARPSGVLVRHRPDRDLRRAPARLARWRRR